MASNRGVMYMGPGVVEVHPIDFPKLELGSRKCEHGAILKIVTTNICGSDQHMVRGRTTAPKRARARARDHRADHRMRPRRGVHEGRRPVLRAFQHRVRPLPQLPRGQDRHLPQRQSGPSRRRLRLRRYGRLGGRPGRVRHGALRRLQPAEVPRPRSGDGEDPRPDPALRHLPDRLPRRGHGGRRSGLHRLRRRRRTRRPCVRRRLPAARRGVCDRRRPDPGATGAGPQLRLRNRRRVQGRHHRRADRPNRRRTRGGLRHRLRRLRGARARPRRGESSVRPPSSIR